MEAEVSAGTVDLAAFREDVAGAGRVHLDPTVLARHLRGRPPHAELTAALFEVSADGGPALQTSAFSVFQLMAEPYRHGEAELAEKAATYLSAGPVELVVVSEDVALRAAEVRARLGFGPGRCVQIATALESGADRYLVDSSPLRRIAEVRILDLEGYLGPGAG
jgi:predicted nucleic acid-binding protein